jgi:hypothetical protein
MTGDYNNITSPVIDSASAQLALNLAAKHNLEMSVLDILTAFLGCLLQETLFMCLPDSKWPDFYSQAHPFVTLSKILYGIKEVN